MNERAGYLSDKIGRKFGMMAATAIVTVFSGLSAASSGANNSLGGMLAMLSAMRYVIRQGASGGRELIKNIVRFLLGIGVGAEYPCGSVSASEQSEEPGINKKAQHRWFTLATNSMIDFGFVVAAFVPFVLYKMCVFAILHLPCRMLIVLMQLRR
jgi:MFS family permease